MNWLSPGALTFYFCLVVLVLSGLSILPVIKNLRKVSEHAGRIAKAPIFSQMPAAQVDLQRLATCGSAVPGYMQRVTAVLAQARTAVRDTGLGEGVQSVRIAMTALRLLVADLR